MKNTFLMTLLILLCLTINAQHERANIDPEIASKAKVDISPIRSPILSVEMFSEIDHSASGRNWNSNLVKVKNIHHNPDEVEIIKVKKTAEKKQYIKKVSSSHESDNNIRTGPGIGSSFHVNNFDFSTPPDNSLAISNEGLIVSVANSTIYYYDDLGNQLYANTLEQFFDDNTLSHIFDPVILFDSEWERFIMVGLNGNSAATSKVLVCFSKSSNPEDGWNYYKLTGNPLDENDWFDYPKIGISTSELFITGNLFSSSNEFEEAVIYQISKYDGYLGNNLTWGYWYNITEDPFTIVPTSHGQEGNIGPGIYLVATDRNTYLSDEYEIFEITDKFENDPELNNYSIDKDFALFGNAMQKGTSVTLDNGDTRALSAFYLSGYIHFVFQTEREDNYAGIKYNRIKVSDLSLQSWIFGLDEFDYCYPSVASFGEDYWDQSVIIGFLRSSSTIYPEFRTVGVDNEGNWTSSTLVKEGETYVNLYGDDGTTRWGDYTGACRRFGTSSPEVWLSGCYGTNAHWLSSWAAQVTEFYVGETEFVKPEKNDLKVFPNPIVDRFYIEFEIDQNIPIRIELYDLNGNLIKIFYNDFTRSGGYHFSFNKNALIPGIYLLKLNTNNKLIQYEKVIVL